MRTKSPSRRPRAQQPLSRKALCLLASVALVAGLVPALALAEAGGTPPVAAQDLPAEELTALAEPEVAAAVGSGPIAPTEADTTFLAAVPAATAADGAGQPAAQADIVTVNGDLKGKATLYKNTFGAEAKSKNPALDEICNLTYIGPYRFNSAGNSNVFGKYDAKIGQPKHSDTAAEALFPTLGTYGGAKLGGEDGAGVNSSSAVLEAPEGASGSDGIVAAYLVVAATQYDNTAAGKVYPLSSYGFGFKGAKGGLRHFYPEYLFLDIASGTSCRVSCFFDVTDFVREEGYGTYTAVNIPFSSMSAFSGTYGSDYFGGWKLIVIEKDAELPTRMVRLMLGGTSVSSTAPAKATISGDGLSIAANPTGEILASLDGTDLDSNQKLNLATSKNGTATAVRYLSEDGKTVLIPQAHFFAFRALNKTADITTTPASSVTNKAYGTFAAGSPIYNTDLTTVDLERLRLGDTDNKVLTGGETSVTATVSTSDAPTILSALGLAADILVPVFETSLTITNLTAQYSTADAGYQLASNYAAEGDHLKATVRAVNISRAESFLGLEDSSIVVQVPAFRHIFRTADEGAEIIARYYSGYEKDPVTGETLPDFELTVAEVTDDSIIVKTPDDAKMNKIKPGGYFEIIFEGTAKGTTEYHEYANEASLKGAFIDETGTSHTDFIIENLGLVTTRTSSDVPRYPVDASADGAGTVTVTGAHEGTGRFDGTGTAHVTWQADEGHRPATVIVDGVARDDLIGKTELDLPIDGREHTVLVLFAPEGALGPDDPGGEPDPDQEVFRVATKGDEGVASITPTANALRGTTADVTWAVAEGYRVIEVLVDGQPYPATATGSLTFKDIAANHSVNVRTAADLYSVTTIAKGPGTISGSRTVRGGADVNVTWEPSANAQVTRVVVDGALVYDRAAQELDRDPGTASAPEPLAQLFSGIDADHVVEVTFEPTDPTVTWDSDLLLATSIVGGEGTISPGARVQAGDSREVSWSAEEGYLVEKVVVTRGTERRVLDPSEYAARASGNAITLANIQADSAVQVVLTAKERVRDDLYHIDTSIYGGPGDITGSMANLEAGSSGHVISWSAAKGWRVAAVHVDGVPRDDLLTDTSVTFDDLAANHTVVVSVQRAETISNTGYYSIDVTCEGAGTAGRSASVAYDGGHTVTWEADDGERVLRVQVDGIERPDLVDATTAQARSLPMAVMFARARVAPSGAFTFSNVRADHTVHVVFSEPEPGPADPDDPDAGKEERFRITTSIAGGKGTVSEAVTVDRGASHTVTWSVEEGSVVAAVYVDGVARPDLVGKGEVTFDDIDAAHTVRVELKAAPPEQMPDDPPAGYHEIKVEGSGKGEVDPPAHVPGGGSHTVTWRGDDGKPPVMVYVDGEPRPDLVDKGEVTFDDVDGPHSVYVQFEGGEPPKDPGDDPDDNPGGDGDTPGGNPGGSGDGSEGDGTGGDGSGSGSGSGAGDGTGSGSGDGAGDGSSDDSGSGADDADGDGKGATSLATRLVKLAQTGDGDTVGVFGCAALGSLAVLVLALRRSRSARDA